MATTNDLRNGLVLNIDGQLWQVVEFQHVKPGKGPAFVRTKIKNVLSGKTVDKTFNAGLKIDTATVDRRDMQFSYRDGEDFVFMDLKSYEQTYVPAATVGDAAAYMLEGQDVIVAFHDDDVLFVELPAAVVLTVTADRLLLPWIRRAGAALAAAGLSSLVLWWSIIVLSDTRASSVVMTVVALGTGAACILLGFTIRATALRHYGLALVLVAVLKLAVFDVVAQSSLTRILALLVGGVVCFGLSLAYNRAATDAEEAREQGAAGRRDGPGA